MKYVEKANLPINAHTILIGEKYCDKLAKPLEKLGIRTIGVPDNPFVDERLVGHADLSLVHLGDNLIAMAAYLRHSEFAKQLEREGLEILFSNAAQGTRYPLDAGLNICICGDKLIYNPKTADDAIVHYLTNERGLMPISVKQGYTKCSVCAVREGAIISADDIIHREAELAGIRSLKIKSGFFDLDGFDYGFIGGSAFKLSSDKIAFTGHIDAHPNRDDILQFFKSHNIEAVYITDEAAFDIGSAIPIIEK